MISIYVEYSKNNVPFKPRKDYDIDWNKVIEISKECGMISSEEKEMDNILVRVTKWAEDMDYDKWRGDQYIREYIKQRNAYNDPNGIIHTLTIVPDDAN